MESIPNEIEDLIHEYRVEFERVDREINDAINQYYTIESTAKQLLHGLQKSGVCTFHLDNVNRALHRTVEQGSYILNRILENEEIFVCETEMLLSLNNEVLYTVFNVLVHPFYLPQSM